MGAVLQIVMARHSHWHNIQLTKGKADARRAQMFSKFARAIAAAVQTGGGADADFNFQLRVAMDAARAVNMPKDNIERAVKRGTGAGGEGNVIEEVLYEGFGPAGTALLIQCLTDNRNRSVSEVRTILSKHGGTLASQGSVKWMFEQKGIAAFDLSHVLDRSALELAAIDAGAQDVKEEEGMLQIICAVSEFQSVIVALESAGFKPDIVRLHYLAKDSVPLIQPEEQAALDRLVDALEVLDDVDTMYTNAA